MAQREENNGALALAHRGRPLFEMALPENPGPAEAFAADELSRTLYAMIGPGARQRSARKAGAMKIYVNVPEAAARAGIDVAALALGSEMFHIEGRGGDLYILGGGPRGVLYGVYDLLETLGCRWYTPEITHIPRRPTLSLLRMHKTGGPAFENRDVFMADGADPLWRVRNRLNGWSVPVPEYMGGFVDYCGFVHTFYALLPPETFFDAHPEYYSLVGGQRRSDHAQLCLTNPDVLRLVTERVLALMEANPRATIFSVSQNDCYGPCECEACSAVAEAEGSQSGPMLRFVNAVAEAAAERFPGKLIDTLAYQYTLDAPRISVPHPNVRVRLCSINCCQGHTYGTCDHPESRRFLRALQAWSERTSQMYIWHYATVFTHYPLPMPDLDELHGNINLYKQTGVRGLFIQGMGEPGGWAESMALRGYVVSKLLWQPDQPVWPLVDEFLQAYYGAGAPQARRYLDIFHGAVRADKSLHPSLYDLPSSRQYDNDLRLPADAALAEAEAATTGEPRERVRMLRGGLRYARLFRAAGTFRREGDTYSGAAAPADVQDLDDLVRLWERAGVLRIREGEDFEFTVQKLRSRLVSHRLEWLRDARQEIAVVPSLGGRVIAWNAGGHGWLAPADPDSTWSLHPFSGGYAESVLLGMHSNRGWGEVYSGAWQDGQLRMTARLGDDLRIARRLWLQDGALHLRTRIANVGRLERPCGWGASMRLALPAEARVTVPSEAGAQEFTWGDLPDGGSLLLTGEKVPNAAWTLRAGDGLVTLQVQGVALARFSLARPAGSLGLQVDWQTAITPLAPGAEIQVHQVIEIN